MAGIAAYRVACAVYLAVAAIAGAGWVVVVVLGGFLVMAVIPAGAGNTGRWRTGVFLYGMSAFLAAAFVPTSSYIAFALPAAVVTVLGILTWETAQRIGARRAGNPSAGKEVPLTGPRHPPTDPPPNRFPPR